MSLNLFVTYEYEPYTPAKILFGRLGRPQYISETRPSGSDIRNASPSDSVACLDFRMGLLKAMIKVLSVPNRWVARLRSLCACMGRSRIAGMPKSLSRHGRARSFTGEGKCCTIPY